MKKNIFLALMVSIISFAPTILLAEETSSFSVPLPAGEKPLDTYEMTLSQRDIKCFLYSSNKSSLEISQFYHNFFYQQGFNKILDQDQGQTKLLRFKKDDLVISFALTPQAAQTQIVIAKYIEPKGAPPIDQLKLSVNDSIMAMPKEDQPGSDFKFIPRPPKSVRWGGLEAGANASLMYSSPLSVGELADFYQKEMPAQGWQLVNEEAVGKAVEQYTDIKPGQGLGAELPIEGAEKIGDVLKGTYVLYFSGSPGEATITIMPNYLGRKHGSLVEISQQKK